MLHRLSSQFSCRDRSEMKINRVRTWGSPRLHLVPPGLSLQAGWRRCGSPGISPAAEPSLAGLLFPRVHLTGLPRHQNSLHPQQPHHGPGCKCGLLAAAERPAGAWSLPWGEQIFWQLSQGSVSPHTLAGENPATHSRHSCADPGEHRYQAAAGLPAGAGTSVVSVPAYSCGCGAPAQGPRARPQRWAPPADVGPGQGCVTGREWPGAQSWQAGKGFQYASLESWGLGGEWAQQSPCPGWALAAPQQRRVPAEGGGGSAPARELAPGTVLGSSWQCQWITVNSISIALIYVL